MIRTGGRGAISSGALPHLGLTWELEPWHLGIHRTSPVKTILIGIPRVPCESKRYYKSAIHWWWSIFACWESRFKSDTSFPKTLRHSFLNKVTKIVAKCWRSVWIDDSTVVSRKLLWTVPEGFIERFVHQRNIIISIVSKLNEPFTSLLQMVIDSPWDAIWFNRNLKYH